LGVRFGVDGLAAPEARPGQIGFIADFVGFHFAAARVDQIADVLQISVERCGVAIDIHAIQDLVRQPRRGRRPCFFDHFDPIKAQPVGQFDVIPHVEAVTQMWGSGRRNLFQIRSGVAQPDRSDTKRGQGRRADDEQSQDSHGSSLTGQYDGSSPLQCKSIGG
jgi:hypothetical protein